MTRTGEMPRGMAQMPKSLLTTTQHTKEATPEASTDTPKSEAATILSLFRVPWVAIGPPPGQQLLDPNRHRPNRHPIHRDTQR